MEYLYMICVGLLIFFSLSILTKRNKPLSEKIFSGWIILLVITVLSFFVYTKGLARQYTYFITFVCDTHLLHGAFLYLYILAFTNPAFRLRKIHLLHLLPFLVQVGTKLYLNYGAGVMECYKTGGCAEEENIFVNLNYVYKYLVLGFYILLSWRVYSKRISGSSTPRDHMRSQWIRQILLGVSFLYTGILLLHTGRIIFPEVFYERMLLGNTLATLFIFIFLYIGNSYTYLFVSPSKKRFINLSEAFNPKECRQSPGSDDIAPLFTRIVTYMNHEKPYIKGQLTLKELSDSIGESPVVISQVINKSTGYNFNEFVNSYRVEMLKEMLANPANWNYKIMALAADCGFKSKTTLIRIFKDQTGVTPGEYLQSVRESMEIDPGQPAVSH